MHIIIILRKITKLPYSILSSKKNFVSKVIDSKLDSTFPTSQDDFPKN